MKIIREIILGFAESIVLNFHGSEKCTKQETSLPLDIKIRFENGDIEFNKLAFVILNFSSSSFMDMLISTPESDTIIFEERKIEEFLLWLQNGIRYVDRSGGIGRTIHEEVAPDLGEDLSKDEHFVEPAEQYISKSAVTSAPEQVLSLSLNCKVQESTVCDYCGKFFKQKKNLKEHLQFVHSDVKSFQCQSCPAMFKRNSDLTVHRKKNHSVETINFDCKKCAKTFSCHSSLKRHLAEKHDSKFKHVQCSSCSKFFVRTHDFKKHSKKCKL